MRCWFQAIIASSVLLLTFSCEGIDDISTDIEPDQEDAVSLDYSPIMSVSGNINPQPQGGDCWGDLFFQFVTGNSCVRVYDLSKKKLVQTIDIPYSQRGFVANCHCNTACFGSQFYDEKDEFPLIYVSTGYASKGYTGALVYRILRTDKKLSLSLVQTIRFPEDKSSWTEFVPAKDYAYLCYTTERVIYKVPVPKADSGDAIIDRSMAVETYQFTPQPEWMSTSRNQDRLFYNGKIVFVSGVPLSGEASVFVVLNLEERTREMTFDFKSIGLTKESESIFVWRDALCVAFLDQIVKLEFS